MVEEENKAGQNPEQQPEQPKSLEQEQREEIEQLFEEVSLGLMVAEAQIDGGFDSFEQFNEFLLTQVAPKHKRLQQLVPQYGMTSKGSDQWKSYLQQLKEITTQSDTLVKSAREKFQSSLPEPAKSEPVRTESNNKHLEDDIDAWLGDESKHPKIAHNFSLLVDDLNHKLTEDSFNPESPYQRGKTALETLQSAIRNFEEFIEIGKQKGGEEFDKMNGLKELYLDTIAADLLQKLYERSYSSWEEVTLEDQRYKDVQNYTNYVEHVLPGLDKSSKESIANNKKDVAKLIGEITHLLEELDRDNSIVGEKKTTFWRRLLREANSNLSQIESKLQEVSRTGKVNGWDEESIVKIPAVRSAYEFFSGGFTPDILPNYQDLEWLKETPEKLACAIWFYVYNTVMQIIKSGDDLYIQMPLISWELPFGEKNSVGKLLESFANFGLLFPDDPVSSGRFRGLAGKLGVDFSTITKIHTLGSGVHEHENDGEGLIKWLSNKEHGLDAEKWERISQMGVGYLDKEKLPVHRDRLLWAMQAWMFINDPEKVDMAVLDTSSDQDPVFARNVLIKSPLTLYPTVVEGKVSDQKLVSTLIQRRLMRKIAAELEFGEKPAWILDPEWKRKPNETLSQLAARRLLIGRSYMQEMLYGAKGATSPRPDSFFERWQKELTKHSSPDHGHGHGGPAIDSAEKQAVDDGFFVEQQASLLMEYFLMPAKAEGVRETARSKAGTRRLGKYREIDGKSGPTADFYIARTLASPQMYSRKLINSGGGDGSHGPTNTKDKWFKFLETGLDRYYYLPANEDEGQTLREAIINSESGNDFSSIPYMQAIATAEDNLAWAKQLELGWFYTDTVMGKGLGVNWHNVVMTEPGTSTTVFSPQIAEIIKKKLSRNAYYSLTRDFGREVTRWPDDQTFAAFREAEDNYLAQRAKGVAAADTVPPTGVSEKLWEEVKNYSRQPTASHQLIDGRNISNRTSPEVVRYATNVFDMVWIPLEEKYMNSFEKAVILSGKNDWGTIIQKLIIGNLFMGDVFRSESANSMTSADIVAFYKLFSREYWEKSKGPQILRDAGNFMAGRHQEPEYNGLGYFTVEEVSAMLQEASVGTGPATWFRGAIEAAQKFGK